ncbi:MAG: pilus assembly protein [Burkholderiales bacterium]
MKKLNILPAIFSVAVLSSPMIGHAEDIDLFVGSAAAGAATRPNVLIVIDNSANWAAANQHWPGGEKQGQAELRSLRTVVGELGDGINLGLMMLTAGTGGNKDGAYPRFAISQMTATNKAALQEMIGTSSCVDGPNSLNGTPNCIFNNYSSGTLNESVGTNVDYSAAMFESFKYFGGYTSPANATTNVAGTPISASQFGALRYSGNPDNRTDRRAFVNPFVDYAPPIDSTNSCAKNYIIFIGNGFPTQDAPASLLSGVGGNTSQLPMQQWSSSSTSTAVSAGFACGSASPNPAATVTARRAADCTANLNQASLLAANPTADENSFVCVAATETTDNALCSGGNNRKFTVQGSNTVITVTATGAAALPGPEARYADEWAKFLYTTDVNSALGQQNVATYTIDVFKDAPDSRQTSLLQNMAKVGGGRYFQATNENAILNALREILVEIQAVNSVFASASLPINATNRSQNENQVFIGMFRPNADARPNWYGNLKRYQIALFNNEAKLADKDGVEAVAAATGFVQACASSYWTTDSGTFWNFASDGAGLCLTSSTSVFSDLPDGPMVEKGATAEVIRRGNDPTASPLTYAENRTIYTCTSPTTCSSLVAFNNTNVSQTAIGAASTTERDNIINYTRGQDLRDENANGITTGETRASLHGDVAHSRPLPVNYGGTTGVVVYYGANDGAFRAISGSTGQELWAFIAPEHHGKLKRLYDNSPTIKYPSTPIGITPTPQPKDYFFDGSAGILQNADSSKVWIYPTMRRGGRMLYAFDVTNPNSPALKWRQGCPNATNDTDCTTGFSGIGQTWSFPNVATIKGYSTTSPVLVVGGGYDSCEDQDISVNTCNPLTAKGNKVYIIDADTGALIKTFSTDRSVAADVTLIDRNFDSLVDHGYVADVGGNLYRIDFIDPATQATRDVADWTITKIARTNVAGDGRKFLFGPAALPSAGPDRVILTIGTGDRERPLEVNYPYVESVQNRFYMFIDTFATTGLPVNLDNPSNLTDLTSNNSCTASIATGAQGWRIDLNSGRGEQTVTSSVIFGGLVFFSTNRPIPATPGVCTGNLGEARGYALNLLNGAGAVGTEALCGGIRSGTFTGGGLPPSPVTGVVPIGGKPVSVMIGGINRSGGASSAIGSQRVKPVISQKRSRQYWYSHGDK